MSAAPGPLAIELEKVARSWARSQRQLVILAADFADSGEWALAGMPSAAHWLALACDVEACTAREWVRVGRRLRELPVTADAFDAGALSYSKVRNLTRIAGPETEAELVDLARAVPAGGLSRALAAWMANNTEPEELEAHQEQQRSVRWRHEPDGMVTFTMRLTPLVAGALIAWLTTWVMTNRTRLAVAESGGGASASASEPRRAFASVAQQRADAVEALVREGEGVSATEVVLHVRGDGCTLDDGTPVADSVVERVAPTSFLRALIHDAERRPVDVSGRRRHPTTRQKRLVKERDRVCVDCGRPDLLEFDHDPPYQASGRTVTDELHVRCAPCHRARHAQEAA